MSDSETDRMRMWREEAMDLARSISTQAVYGPVILGPELAKRVSSMLRSAEPPGNGLQCLRMGLQEAQAPMRQPVPDMIPATVEEFPAGEPSPGATP